MDKKVAIGVVLQFLATTEHGALVDEAMNSLMEVDEQKGVVVPRKLERDLVLLLWSHTMSTVYGESEKIALEWLRRELVSTEIVVDVRREEAARQEKAQKEYKEMVEKAKLDKEEQGRAVLASEESVLK